MAKTPDREAVKQHRLKKYSAIPEKVMLSEGACDPRNIPKPQEKKIASGTISGTEVRITTTQGTP